MLAIPVVEAFGGDDQFVDHSVVHDGLFHNAWDIGQCHMTVKDALRVNRDAWPVLALVEAACRVGSDERIQSARFDFGLEGVSQCFRTFRIAATSRVTGGSLIAANEKMMCERRHECFCELNSLRHIKLKTTTFDRRASLFRATMPSGWVISSVIQICNARQLSSFSKQSDAAAPIVGQQSHEDRL